MEYVNIQRISKTEYTFRNSVKDGIKVVAKALTFRNPSNFAYQKDIPMFDKRNLTFHIGMLSNVIKECKKRKVGYEIEDYEYQMPDVEIDSRMSGNYIHQRYAVEAFFKKRFGIIVVPTRGGKTFIASEIIRIFLATEKQGQVLFCVDNTTLFTQAVGDIKEFFEPYGGIEVGEICAGKVDTSKRVTVAMIQTIQSVYRNKKNKVRFNEMNKFLKGLKFLCVDEVHDNCSDSKLKLYKRCRNLDYQLCLSATPYRSKQLVQNLKLQAWSGDVAYTITEDTLRERKVLSDYKVFELLVDHNSIAYGDLDGDDYAELRKKIIFQSDVRNGALIKVLDIVQRLNLKTLVLFKSIEHGSNIGKLTGIPFISGRDKSREREKYKQAFLSQDGGILLASDIFKKGVTLPSCEVLINVDGGLEDANVIQKKGRVLGTTKNKDRSAIIDFIDVYDAYFSEHSEARLSTYVNAIGEKRVGILDTSADDCFDTLEQWIKKWFRISD